MEKEKIHAELTSDNSFRLEYTRIVVVPCHDDSCVSGVVYVTFGMLHKCGPGHFVYQQHPDNGGKYGCC